MPAKPLTIGVVGLWHLGSVYAASLAELGHRVVGFDADADVAEKLSRGVSPIAEEGLSALLKKNVRTGRLRFTSDLTALASSDAVWITIDTPVRAQNRPDVRPIRAFLALLAPHLHDNVCLIVSSQVPVGSGEQFVHLIRKKRPRLRFSYCYQPENLQLGKALHSFFHPARIVAGASDAAAHALIRRIFSGVRTPKLHMDIASAEMAKHAVNAFLATSLSFIYDISDMCEAFDADVLRVSEALKSDARIGRAAYLDASIGFSGATLGRDLTALLDRADTKRLRLPVIAGARAKNEKRWQMAVSLLRKELSPMHSATVGFLGVAYKPGTSTTRDSLSLKLMRALFPLVREVRAHDYLVPREEVLAAGPYRVCADPYELARGSSALLLMTAWPEYQALDFKKIGRSMKGPKLFFDAKNALSGEEEKIRAAGLRYVGVGRGRVCHTP